MASLHLNIPLTIYVLVLDCGIPENPVNGIATYNATTYGEIATIRCSEGFQLNGSTEINCTEHGTWSSDDYKCNVHVIGKHLDLLS